MGCTERRPIAGSLAQQKLELLEELRRLREEKERLSPGLIRYRDDPAGFADAYVDFEGVSDGLTEYQEEILSSLPRARKVAVRGPHGLGKTTIAAIVVLWFALTREAQGRDWKCVTTAGSWRQLEHYLWPEIRKWAHRLRWEEMGRAPLDERSELLALRMRMRHGEAFAAASDKPELIEGCHADSVLYIFDESKAIVPETFDAAEGAFSGATADGRLEALALAMSTPGEPAGRFYQIHTRAPGLGDWHPRHVTLDEAIKAGRVSLDWADRRAEQWGTLSAVYANRVLGEFHSSDEDAVIPLSWIEAACDRWREWDAQDRPDPGLPHIVGVDVARSGTDKTVLALRRGNVITELRTFTREDTMSTAGRVAGLLTADPVASAIVDVIGIGAGVIDRLREDGYRADPFTASARTSKRDKSGEFSFVNARSGAWWSAREQLDPSRGSLIALPPDDDLIGDLCAPHWRVMSGGRIQVETKDDLRTRIGRSTDKGDAVIQSLWTQGGSWLDAYGVVKCVGCGAAYPRDVRKSCPRCGKASQDAEEEAA